MAVRRLEGRIGAYSAASYVELGRWAGVPADTHRVKLHSWPASSRSVGRFATTTIATRIAQPADACLVAAAVAAMPTPWNPRLHARPSTAAAADRTLA